MPVSSNGSGGLAGAFTIGLSGLSAGAGAGTGTSTTTNEVEASLLSTRFVRTRTGHRLLRVKLDVNERVTVNARLSRGNGTLARRSKGWPAGQGHAHDRAAGPPPVKAGARPA